MGERAGVAAPTPVRLGIGRPGAGYPLAGTLWVGARRRALREAAAGYLFLLPGLVPMLLFVLLPIFGGLFFSFLEWNLLQPWTFVGLENYRKLSVDPEFWGALRVSATYMAGVVPAGMLVSLCLALALNHGRRGILFYRTLYFMPVVTATVAVALLWRWLYAGQLGLINTLLALVGVEGPNWLGDADWALPVPMVFSAYGTFLLRQYFKTIPGELDDAARIDGAGYLTVYWRIFVPLSGPALATLGVFVFLFFWNTLLWPLVVTNSMEMRTVPFGLAMFLGKDQIVQWNLLMAASTVAVVPTLVVFLAAQKYFVQGITLTGIKG